MAKMEWKQKLSAIFHEVRFPFLLIIANSFVVHFNNEKKFKNKNITENERFKLFRSTTTDTCIKMHNYQYIYGYLEKYIPGGFLEQNPLNCNDTMRKWQYIKHQINTCA